MSLGPFKYIISGAMTTLILLVLFWNLKSINSGFDITFAIFAVTIFLLSYLLHVLWKLFQMKKELEKLNQEMKAQLQREDELKQMVKTINDSSIIAVTDLKGRIIEVNENFSRISGYSREELLGQDHRILNSGYHSKSFFKDLWQTILAGNTWSGEVRNRAKDGSLYWVQTFVSPLKDSSGNVTKFISVRLDITKSKKDEAMIMEQQGKLISSSRLASLGEMAGSIAHEINNPLGIISGRADQLLRYIKDGRGTKEFAEAKLEKIILATERIAKIIRGMRVFSRNGEADPFETFTVKDLIVDVLGLCQQRFIGNNIKLNVRVHTDAAIHGQMVQLGQVLLNLLNNAYDAVADLPEKWVEIDVIDTDGKVRFRVFDSGEGVPPELAEKIMQPFFTTKKVGQGTGLGLSIAKGIVEQHKGQLWIDLSQPHTCFVIEIPTCASRVNELAA
jgi:PAS domain S-box-containing protein